MIMCQQQAEEDEASGKTTDDELQFHVLLRLSSVDCHQHARHHPISRADPRVAHERPGSGRAAG